MNYTVESWELNCNNCKQNVDCSTWLKFPIECIKHEYRCHGCGDYIGDGINAWCENCSSLLYENGLV